MLIISSMRGVAMDVYIYNNKPNLTSGRFSSWRIVYRERLPSPPLTSPHVAIFLDFQTLSFVKSASSCFT